MKKGIVMEVNDTCLTLLTPDGQFLQASLQEHPNKLGQEILFTPISQKKFVNRFLGIKQLSIVAAALLIFSVSLIPVYESNKAYAYMSIDVNPSIELGFNKQMQVVKLKAFNSDGKKIISQIGDWEKKSVTDFTQKVLKEMKKDGYLNSHHSMVISTVRTENPEEQTENQLTKNMGQIKEMARENDLQVTVLNGTEKEMEKAHQLGITTGKYKESKMHPPKKENSQQPAQSQEREKRGTSAQNNNSNSVKEVEIEKVNPNTPSQNNSNPDQGKAFENQTPPGQLKKAEEVPKEQWKQSKTETKNTYKSEKKSSPINNSQSKNLEHKQNQESQNKKN